MLPSLSLFTTHTSNIGDGMIFPDGRGLFQQKEEPTWLVGSGMIWGVLGFYSASKFSTFQTNQAYVGYSVQTSVIHGRFTTGLRGSTKTTMSAADSTAQHQGWSGVHASMEQGSKREISTRYKSIIKMLHNILKMLANKLALMSPDFQDVVCLFWVTFDLLLYEIRSNTVII